MGSCLERVGLLDQPPDRFPESASELGERETSVAAHEQRRTDEAFEAAQ
ncbi:hypothetical protein ACFPK1_00595 [Actinomycetospora rhizophila]|uniref:Uncharacterized protein n=1 Tax=Actinomycetospora rhizophila TaxID=1416876 RepID=A0ABV9Z677_9PSEU